MEFSPLISLSLPFSVSFYLMSFLAEALLLLIFKKGRGDREQEEKFKNQEKKLKNEYLAFLQGEGLRSS